MESHHAQRCVPLTLQLQSWIGRFDNWSWDPFAAPNLRISTFAPWTTAIRRFEPRKNRYLSLELTVFFSRETAGILRAFSIAIRLLKFPVLEHSKAASIQNSIICAR